MILDLMLPDQRNRAVSPARKPKPLPVLILTARDDTDEKVVHFEAGADDYLTKPFAFRRTCWCGSRPSCGRTPSTRPTCCAVADLELNRLTQLVKRGGHRIDLTAKEYALFEYLLCSPGRVFSRTMILNHVWDQSFEGVTNIVDVYVRYLRKKVDEPFPLKLIHTVRGVGYCVRDGATSGV